MRLTPLFAFLAMACTVVQVEAQPDKAPFPISAFFDAGNVQAMSLSPNQRWLAAQVASSGDTPARLVVSDLQGKEAALAVLAFPRVGVRWFRWVNDELLIAGVADKLEVSADGGNEALVSVTRDGKSSRTLIRAYWETDFGSTLQPLEGNHFFETMGKPGSDEIIVSAGKYDRQTQLYTLTLLAVNARTSGRRSLLDSYPPNTVGFLFDPQGRPRFARSFSAGFVSYHWRDPEQSEWRQFARFENLKAPYSPAFIDGEGRLYVAVPAAGNAGDGLHRYDFAADKPEAEPLLNTPGFDSAFRPIIDRRDGELLGVRTQLDADETVWLKPAIAEVQKRVDALLPGRVNTLLCGHCDQSDLLLVHSESDRAPGDYLLVQHRTGQMQPLGKRRPSIDPNAMAPVQFERIKARDGHDLPVYVTLPGGTAGPPRPAVLLVHGGPHVRGRDWSWEADSQFLASRGYVVIEPEFRGSSGFGSAHELAGFKQWGQAMQDDLSDAVAWAVKQGWVDGSRVCIAGASYGGYATLMGLAKTPEAYRCGVAWVAVSDLKLLFSASWSDISRTTKQYTMKATVGDPEKDKAMFDAYSPINLADRIKAPVLLAYGATDRRVPIEHGEGMRAALRKAGREPEWVVYPNEEHGWVALKTKTDFWQRVETFLARNLKP